MIALSMPQVGGVAPGLLGVGGDGKTDIERDNAEKTARWRQDDMISLASRGNQGAISAAINANARSEDMAGNNATSLQTAAMQSDAAKYGHQVNAMQSAARDGVTMRGQDINAMSDAARLGLEGKRIDVAKTAEDRAAERWNVERPGLVASAKDSETVRNARQGLMAAIESGDPKAIEKAKSAAVAAGIKFDKPNNEYVTATDSMGMNITRTNKDTGAVDVIDGKSGKVKASIPAPGTQQQVQVQASPDALAHLKQNPGLAPAFKAKYGYLPEGF